jgi:hypothetical protein
LSAAATDFIRKLTPVRPATNSLPFGAQSRATDVQPTPAQGVIWGGLVRPPLRKQARKPHQGSPGLRSLSTQELVGASQMSANCRNVVTGAGPLPFSLPSALGVPPQSLLPSSARLLHPRVSARGARPPRPERRVSTSITTQRVHHARARIHDLPSCPWCGHSSPTSSCL